jgi:putative transcriptional regulator
MTQKIENTLRIWRAKFDISQDSLASGIDVSRQTIHAIERGKFVPSIHIALKLAKYFGTTVEELFRLKEEKADDRVYI